jgi:hypothetical protein
MWRLRVLRDGLVPLQVGWGDTTAVSIVVLKPNGNERQRYADRRPELCRHLRDT